MQARFPACKVLSSIANAGQLRASYPCAVNDLLARHPSGSKSVANFQAKRMVLSPPHWKTYPLPLMSLFNAVFFGLLRFLSPHIYGWIRCC